MAAQNRKSQISAVSNVSLNRGGDSSVVIGGAHGAQTIESINSPSNGDFRYSSAESSENGDGTDISVQVLNDR